MKLGIMQPYFFPYLGYISLIKHTDMFILFDTVQFIRHGWIERNRVLKQDEGWLYIQVPLIKEKGRDTLIKDIKIDNKQKWQQKILSQLQPYKKTAPYYKQVIAMLTELFNNEFNDLTALNKASLEKICDFLEMKNHIKVFSEMNLEIENANAPDEWALNICKAIDNVDEYWNPPGGQSFFDKTKYDDAKIKLKFHSVELQEYNQKRKNFEPGLSIIDVLMFNSVSEIHNMLDNYTLI